jgi:hypothetical protein
MVNVITKSQSPTATTGEVRVNGRTVADVYVLTIAGGNASNARFRWRMRAKHGGLGLTYEQVAACNQACQTYADKLHTA